MYSTKAPLTLKLGFFAWWFLCSVSECRDTHRVSCLVHDSKKTLLQGYLDKVWSARCGSKVWRGWHCCVFCATHADTAAA